MTLKIDVVCNLYESTGYSVAWDSPFCENYLYVLSHGVTKLKWHTPLIAISASGDGDEMGVSFS